jgi:hypothetical protein
MINTREVYGYGKLNATHRYNFTKRKEPYSIHKKSDTAQITATHTVTSHTP